MSNFDEFKNSRAEAEMRAAGEKIMKEAREKSESSMKDFPSKDGWYLVLIEDYNEPTPEIIVPNF
jgi:hypothetical protein